MSEIGSTLPATWTILSSSKQRTTFTIASVWDIGEELVAQAFALGRTGYQASDIDEFDDCMLHFCGLTISDSCYARRGSGTSTIPTFGSMVQNG